MLFPNLEGKPRQNTVLSSSCDPTDLGDPFPAQYHTFGRTSTRRTGCGHSCHVVLSPVCVPVPSMVRAHDQETRNKKQPSQSLHRNQHQRNQPDVILICRDLFSRTQSLSSVDAGLDATLPPLVPSAIDSFHFFSMNLLRTILMLLIVILRRQSSPQPSVSHMAIPSLAIWNNTPFCATRDQNLLEGDVVLRAAPMWE